MNHLQIAIAASFGALLAVTYAGHRWIAPAPALAGRHAGRPSVKLPRRGRHRPAKLSRGDARTVVWLAGIKASLRDMVADTPEPGPGQLPDMLPESDTGTFRAVNDASLTSGERALGVPLSRGAAETFARTWEWDAMPGPLGRLVYPYAELDQLNAAWLLFRDATLRADAIRAGTEHWCVFYAYEDLPAGEPSEAAIDLAEREASEAFAALIGGPFWACGPAGSTRLSGELAAA